MSMYDYCSYEGQVEEDQISVLMQYFKFDSENAEECVRGPTNLES